MKIENGTAAVVTGAASGLGKATAIALANAGHKVAIMDLNEEAGTAVAQEIGGIFCKADILSEDSVLAAFDMARAAHGQERVLVHCAVAVKAGKTVAWDRKTESFKRFSSEDYEFSAQGVAVATYRVASISALGMAGLEPLEDGERGVITLTASAAAQDAQIGQVAYGSLKAAVNGLALPMARDLMDLGIRVNSIMPGIFATPPLMGMPENVLNVLNASVPFPKRMGRPEEFASLVMELVRNSYFNGQNIRLDGAIRMPPK